MHLLTDDGVAQLISGSKFPPSFTVKGTNFSFIVLSPQFDKYPIAKDVEDFTQYAKESYRVDSTRIYLSGLSMGSFVISQMGGNYPLQLAAIVPISGTVDDTLVCRHIAKSNLPVWVFHN